MIMCYHTICIYSFCGHTSVSHKSLRNAPPCQCQRTGPTRPTEPDQPHPQTNLITNKPSSLLFDSSFPSPQEFEFARELHHSVPASPVSPIVSRRNQGSLTRAAPIASIDATAALSFSTIFTSYDFAAFPALPLTASPCQNAKSHPFRTYVVSTHCPPCRVLRESNIARLEAKAVKESLEREGGSVTERTVDDSGRKKRKITGRAVKPLLLVEQERVRRETPGQEKENQVMSKAIAREEVPEVPAGYVAVIGSDEPDIEGRSSGEAKAGAEAGQVPPTPTPTPAPPAASSARTATPPSSSKWASWWNRKASPAQSKSTVAVSDIAPGTSTVDNNNRKPPTGDSIDGSACHGSTKEGTPAKSVDQDNWPEWPVDDGIARDAAGRNAKGMQRILGWDGGQTNAA